MKKIVIAIGGNAILKSGQKETYKTMSRNLNIATKSLIPIIKKYKTIITHGNGSEVGLLLLQNELSKKTVSPFPLDILGAESQGLIGYPLESHLINNLRNTNKQVATILTQVLVDKNDPAFKNPTKFVGPYYSKSKLNIIKQYGIVYKKDANKGYRRVVPSPKPIKILEIKTIEKLMDENIIVIAAGGGGIPVYKDKNKLKGIAAVIDKDLTSALLANSINAELLLILTNGAFVCLNFGKKNQVKLRKLSLKEASKYLSEGQYPPGNMGPKIQAAINFILSGGKKVIITDIKNAEKALRGKVGTQITK